MPLINCKVYLELNWIENCVLSSIGDTAKFAIADAKLHVPIVTLSTKDSANLAKKLNEGSKRSVYWNNYEAKSAKVIENGKNLYELLNASFPGVKGLFAFACVIADGAANDEKGIKNNRRCFIPRGETKDYKVLIDGRYFYDQPINDIEKQYDEIRKVSTEHGHDYTTGFYWIMHISKTITK